MARRPDLARLALDKYRHITGYPKGDDDQTVLGDLLCDLRYLCDDEGMDFDAANEAGLRYYNDPEDSDPVYVVTYGQPGGRWTGVCRSMDATIWEVHNEGGDILYSDNDESMARAYAREVSRSDR